MTSLTQVKERPILFNAAMVRAILEGLKRQTRRPVKGAPDCPQGWYPDAYNKTDQWTFWGPRGTPESGKCQLPLFRCPYGQPGDRLWVKERWRPNKLDATVRYSADGNEWRILNSDGARFDLLSDRPGWRPSIHMPRWASRITLEIAEVRVERLQDISEADAWAEGVTKRGKFYSMDWSELGKPTGMKDLDGHDVMAIESFIGNDNIRGAFASYFEQISGSDSWDKNPWVWVFEFKRI